MGLAGPAPFQALRVLKRDAQHLHAAADPKHLAAAGGIADQLPSQATGPQGRQIPQGLLAPRHDHRIRLAQGLAGLEPAQLDARFGLKGIEVGEIAERRETQYDDLQGGVRLAPAALQQVEGVFGGKQLIQPGHHPEHGHTRVLLQPGAPGIKEFAAAAEAVDQQAADEGPLHRPQQGQGPHQLGEHPAPLDVGHQQAVGAQVLGQAQVGEVPRLQVDFHRAAGPLEHQAPAGMGPLQAVEAGANRRPAGLEPVAVVVLGPGRAHGLP